MGTGRREMLDLYSATHGYGSLVSKLEELLTHTQQLR